MILCALLVQEKVSALETQASQLGLQASQECERLIKDRTLALQMLHKVPAPSADRLENKVD